LVRIKGETGDRFAQKFNDLAVFQKLEITLYIYI